MRRTASSLACSRCSSRNGSNATRPIARTLDRRLRPMIAGLGSFILRGSEMETVRPARHDRRRRRRAARDRTVARRTACRAPSPRFAEPAHHDASGGADGVDRDRRGTARRHPPTRGLRCADRLARQGNRDRRGTAPADRRRATSLRARQAALHPLHGMSRRRRRRHGRDVSPAQRLDDRARFAGHPDPRAASRHRGPRHGRGQDLGFGDGRDCRCAATTNSPRS